MVAITMVTTVIITMVTITVVTITMVAIPMVTGFSSLDIETHGEFISNSVRYVFIQTSHTVHSFRVCVFARERLT